MDIKTLKEKLDAGVVAFKYIKKSDGSERYAIGTTNSEIIDKLQGVGKARELEIAETIYSAFPYDEYENVLMDREVASKVIHDLGMRKDDVPKKSKAHNDSVHTYFDLQAMGFRSFSVDSELSFIA